VEVQIMYKRSQQKINFKNFQHFGEG